MKNTLFCIIALLVCSTLFWSCDDDEIVIPRIKISLESTSVSSFGASDGAITATVEGGQPPYQYFWNTGSTDKGINGLPAGEYTLKVVDSESAVASVTVILEQPEPTPLDLQFNVSDASWYTGTDGSVALTVSGGTPPCTYLWSNEEEGTNLEDLSAGTYSVTVTDSGDPAIVTVDSVVVSQPAFVCGRDSILDVQGNKYPTVKIGEQCWLAQNLRTTVLPKDPQTPIDGHFCNGTNCSNAMGAHYSWDALMNGAESVDDEAEVQGICPCEWHVPTKAEWEQLNAYLSVDGNGGSGSNVPNKLRGEDSPSGFDALHAGNWGYAVFAGENAVFWTATEQSDGRAFYRILNNFPLLGQGHVDKRSGLSVRCVRNEE